MISSCHVLNLILSDGLPITRFIISLAQSSRNAVSDSGSRITDANKENANSASSCFSDSMRRFKSVNALGLRPLRPFAP